MFLLFLVTLTSLARAILPAFFSWVISYFYTESSSEKLLHQTENEIKEKLTSLSIVNEFAKYAKLQRQLNKIHEDLSINSNIRQTKYTKIKLIVNYLVYFFHSGSIVYLMWQYMLTPAAILPPEWIKPFELVISWPTGVAGGIGLSIWLLMVESSLKTISACPLFK